eukprot:7377526-Prymnesium_polylepis.1
MVGPAEHVQGTEDVRCLPSFVFNAAVCCADQSGIGGAVGLGNLLTVLFVVALCCAGSYQAMRRINRALGEKQKLIATGTESSTSCGARGARKVHREAVPSVEDVEVELEASGDVGEGRGNEAPRPLHLGGRQKRRTKEHGGQRGPDEAEERETMTLD